MSPSAITDYRRLLRQHQREAGRSKRVVYIDQCVLSQMAKQQAGLLQGDAAAAANALASALQSAVHEQETVICAQSHFHEKESGPVTAARGERGQQIFKQAQDIIERYSWGLRTGFWHETVRAVSGLATALKLGRTDFPAEQLWEFGFNRNPSLSIEEEAVEFRGSQLLISVSWNANPRPMYTNWAPEMERQRSEGKLGDYATERKKADNDMRWWVQQDLKRHSWGYRWGREESDFVSSQEVQAFALSDELFGIPYVDVSSRLFAHVLSEPKRAFQNADAVDIDVLSTTIPYVDMVMADTYMIRASQMRNIEGDYGTRLFTAKLEDYHSAATWLQKSEE